VLAAQQLDPRASSRRAQLPRELSETEWRALSVAVAPGGQHVRQAARAVLRGVLEPIASAGEVLNLDLRATRWVQRSVLRGMVIHDSACGSWDAPTWMAVARTAGFFRPNVLAVAYRLGSMTGDQILASGVHPTHLARRLFGRPKLESELTRVRSYLQAVGYGRAALDDNTLASSLAMLFVQIGRAELEALTVEVIQAAHLAAPVGSDRRATYYRLAHALHGMGILPRGIPQRAYACIATANMDPEWAAWSNRWRATTTLAPKTIELVYYGVLKAGRWLAREHPDVRSPDGWTREVALAYVGAVNRSVLGDLVTAGAFMGGRRGAPLSPRSKARLLGALRIFFRDCQEWGWCARRFDPARALATPRSVKALIAPNPRVLADDVWAKLLWAGLQLQEGDLPSSDGGVAPIGRPRLTYPVELVKATAIAWLFAGLRSDELVRLRVGCIRWQRADGGPAAAAAHVPGDGATCLLDVPTHKTGTNYTKPVDPLVGEAIALWEARRPVQPLLVDRKTGELVAVLFCFRGRAIPTEYFNQALIPLLCRKAGVPVADARGRITSHRARATIASQLYNAKEPMTLFELQAWLGHRSPAATQHYARIAPTTLAKAYADAGYFARNVRTIEVLIDREAVQTGAVANGRPWQYFDLGHGYCTYSFFEQCPHRLACARCDFYLPKDSTRAQLLEARGNLQRMLAQIPLTDDERVAVEDGTAAVEQLIERLTDVPTPAGPTPRQLAQAANFIPLADLDRSLYPHAAPWKTS
jgi:integrase